MQHSTVDNKFIYLLNFDGAMEKSNMLILIISILVIISGIVTVVGIVSFPSLSDYPDATFDEMSGLKDRMFNPFNTLILPIANFILLVGWLALFIMIPLFARRKGFNMVPWGALSFFLAPIAGLVFVFKK